MPTMKIMPTKKFCAHKENWSEDAWIQTGGEIVSTIERTRAKPDARNAAHKTKW